MVLNKGMETNTTTTHRPLIAGENFEVSCLDSFDAVEVAGRNLRAGMVLLDELDCATIVLDHRVRVDNDGRPHYGGLKAFMAWNLDGKFQNGSSFGYIDFGANATYRVAAR